jgi:hypothetical protein
LCGELKRRMSAKPLNQPLKNVTLEASKEILLDIEAI